MMYLEIQHAPFNDGTPRHPLLTVEIPIEFVQDIENLFIEGCCETDGAYDYHQVIPAALDGERKRVFSKLLADLGIVGSIWVEYFIKVSDGGTRWRKITGGRYG